MSGQIPSLFRAAAPLPPLCLIAALLAGCGPTYSPDTYSSLATQQANKVDQGIVVGVRAVKISIDAALGAATGAAAGGIAGSQLGGGGPATALGALGGGVAGGVAGNIVSHAAGDTDGFEYIVKKPNGDLLSVTQKDAAPLAVGAHVLIIEGSQARIVPDYTVSVAVPPPRPPEPQAPGAIPVAPLPAPVAPSSTAPTPNAPPPSAPPPSAPVPADPPTGAPSPSTLILESPSAPPSPPAPPGSI